MAIDTSNNDSAAVIKSLSMGSGVDIQALAKNLSEAENQAKVDRVNQKKTQSELNISGLGTLKSAVGSLKTQLELMRNRSGLVFNKVNSSDPAMTVSTSGLGAPAGNYAITVQQHAKPQQSSFEINSETDISNIGALSIVVGGNTYNLTSESSGAELVSSINDADIGVTAQLINSKEQTGGTLVDNWVITLQGSNGTKNNFTVSGQDSSSNPLTVTTNQAAQDAILDINGMDVYRSDNIADDILLNSSLDYRNVKAGDTVKLISTTSYDSVKDLLSTFVSTFNDLMTVFGTLEGPLDEDEPLAGSLARERSLISSLKSQLSGMLDTTAGTSSGSLNTLRDLGLNFSMDGTLQIEEKIFNAKMEDSPDDVVNLLTANLDNQSEYTAAEDRGLLLQISINLDNLIGGQGVLTSKLRSEEKNIADYEDQLIALEERLQRSYQRYIEQFAAMESFVQRSKEMGKYLENQFKAMQNSND